MCADDGGGTEAPPEKEISHEHRSETGSCRAKGRSDLKSQEAQIAHIAIRE